MSGSSVAATSGSRHVTLGKKGVTTLGGGLILGLSPVPNITSKEHLTAFCGRTSNAELKALGEQVLEITGILDRNLRDRLEGIFKGGAYRVEELNALRARASAAEFSEGDVPQVASALSKLPLSLEMLQRHAERTIKMPHGATKPALEHLEDSPREKLLGIFRALETLAVNEREVIQRILRAKGRKPAPDKAILPGIEEQRAASERPALPAIGMPPRPFLRTNNASRAAAPSARKSPPSAPPAVVSLVDQYSARMGELRPDLKPLWSSSHACSLFGKTNRTMHPSSHLNDWQTLYVSQHDRSPFKSALGHSPAENILNRLYSGLRDGRSGKEVVGANLRFKQGLVLVTTQDAESLPKPKGIMQRLGRFISGPEKREPHTAVSLTFIPPNRIEDCGEQFKRVDERAFLAVLTVLIPTSVLPDLNALLQSEDKARGALYAALLAPDTSNEAARAVEKIREGILYPLARNLAGLAQDTPGDKIPPNALMAAMGMFRIKPWNTKKGAEQLGDFIEGEVRLR